MIGRSEEEEVEKGSQAKRPGRTWTERITGPIRYRRYTADDAGGRRHIFFKFELAAGEKDPPQEVYDVLHEMKHLEVRPGHGRNSPHTGLQFSRDPRHGRVWKLPDTPMGRFTADLIDARLADLVRRLDAGMTKDG